MTMTPWQQRQRARQQWRRRLAGGFAVVVVLGVALYLSTRGEGGGEGGRFAAVPRERLEVEGPPASDLDLARLDHPAAQIAPGRIDCPQGASPASPPEGAAPAGLAQVLRVSDGCLVVDLVPLHGQTIRQLRTELFVDPAVIAVDAITVAVLDVGSSPGSDPDRSKQWYLDDLSIDKFHDRTEPKTDVRVAVIDSGVDWKHEDLDARVNDGAGGRDGLGKDDPNGHGTHVAGLIAAGRDNGIGIVGMAPKANIVPLVVISSDVDYYFFWERSVPALTLADAIGRAVNEDVDVINMSLAESTPGESLVGTQPNSLTEAAVRIAIRNGVIVVASAGNCGSEDWAQQGCARQSQIQYPAAYNGVVAVAALGERLDRVGFSTVAPHVDLAAPGDEMYSLWPGGGFKTRSGTSQAAPIVSGIAARIKGAFPDTETAEVVEVLQSTARRIDDDGNAVGTGLVDPLAAVEELERRAEDREAEEVAEAERRSVADRQVETTVVDDEPESEITVTEELDGPVAVYCRKIREQQQEILRDLSLEPDPQQDPVDGLIVLKGALQQAPEELEAYTKFVADNAPPEIAADARALSDIISENRLAILDVFLKTGPAGAHANAINDYTMEHCGHGF